jgi:hypothetical protein
VVPAWSLNLLEDGTVEPVMPADIWLRDGDLIRPVCPFFEVWAMVSGAASDSPAVWEERPLTTPLLEANGASEAAVRLHVDAQNRKAARRAADSRLVFGTFPPVGVRADRHTAVSLHGVNPPGVPLSG